MAHPRARRADHFGQRLLADFRQHRLGLAVLAKISEEQQHPGQPLLAGIEQLIAFCSRTANGLLMRMVRSLPMMKEHIKRLWNAPSNSSVTALKVVGRRTAAMFLQAVVLRSPMGREQCF